MIRKKPNGDPSCQQRTLSFSAMKHLVDFLMINVGKTTSHIECWGHGIMGKNHILEKPCQGQLFFFQAFFFCNTMDYLWVFRVPQNGWFNGTPY